MPTTRLYVKTLPPGAQVTLDGAPLGPRDGLFVVQPGMSRVRVEFEGREPQERVVEIAPGRITRLEVLSATSDVSADTMVEPSVQLADIAARVHALETRLATHGGLDLPRLPSAWDIDSQGVIRSAEGAVLGQWGIDQPHLHQQVHR